MDCASCAGVIRGTLERLPGVRDVSVSVMAERLTLTLDADTTGGLPGRTGPDAVERAVRELAELGL